MPTIAGASPRRLRGLGWRVVVALVACAPVAHGQRVSGTVTDTRTAQPVAGVVLSVVDSAGQSSARTVSDAGGRFVLPTSARVKELQVRRIGFRPQNLPVPDSIRLGKSWGPIHLVLQPVPQMLDPVTVDAGCPVQPTAGQALALWEQAQAGFLGAVVARDENRANLRVLRFERDVLSSNNEIARFAVSKHDTVSTSTFGAVRTPAEFAERGYIEERSALRAWYAPDVDVLLDASFRRTHCFSIAKADRAPPGQVGIDFQPTAGRGKIPDVRGTLWINQSPLALHQLDFNYTGGESDFRSGDTGGRLSFRTADNGVIVIDDWLLRADGVFAPAGALPVQSLHETGGALLSATWGDGTMLRRHFNTVTGTVTDAKTKQPIPNVWIDLPNTFYRAITNRTGAFRIDDVLPGEYGVDVADSSLADFGMVRSGAIVLRVGSDETPPLAVKLEEWIAVAQRRCSALRGIQGGAVLMARVVDQEGMPVNKRLDFDTKVTIGDVAHTIFGSADQGGRLTICRVPGGIVDITVTDDDSTHRGAAEVPVSGMADLDTVTIVFRRVAPSVPGRDTMSVAPVADSPPAALAAGPQRRLGVLDQPPPRPLPLARLSGTTPLFTQVCNGLIGTLPSIFGRVGAFPTATARSNMYCPTAAMCG